MVARIKTILQFNESKKFSAVLGGKRPYVVLDLKSVKVYHIVKCIYFCGA